MCKLDARLKKDNVNSEKDANEIHYEIGRNVREAIKMNKGTMPEDLPTPNKSLKDLEKENKSIVSYNIDFINKE